MILPEEVFFPHEKIRPVQDILISTIRDCLSSRQHLLVHAPTGLGKTAAALAPAISYAIKNDKTVIFVTSRNTQHRLALNTISEIKRRYGLSFHAADIIGKKWLCLQPHVTRLQSGDFNEYCRKLREDELCEYYERLKEKTTVKALLSSLKEKSPNTTDHIISTSKEKKLCPYEISILIAKESRAIITDYYYIFHPKIQQGFFQKMEKNLGDIILIVDEAHNLASRVKDLASEKISTLTLQRALQEAKKLNSDSLVTMINRIHKILSTLAEGVDEERHVTKDAFLSKLGPFGDIDNIIDEFTVAGDAIRKIQAHSSLGTVASFLERWRDDDPGFTRILKKGKEGFITLHYTCLDPSRITGQIINSTHATILMSGTLMPTSMYKEILGIDNPKEIHLQSPFPKKNRLNLIIPKTSTKYETRSPKTYAEIAHLLSQVLSRVPGNVAVYFPSYYLQQHIAHLVITTKPAFFEESVLTKQEKDELLERFRSYKKSGAALFAVISGNFGEGIDLPHDELRTVVIVGLPLTKPDLETKALIGYYDKKFGKGWDYGYIFPAFTKAIQAGGRCIRTETDKGAIIFIDERYTWKNYYRCFPKEWDIKISLDYQQVLTSFFS
jgi:DNA excision repair protein ERCC-2